MPERLLEDLWTTPPEGDDLELLRYRSNLLGADTRITNFAGGNTSSKIDIGGARVLAVKGSGGDLGSIRREGFALLDLKQLEGLKAVYRGEAFEDEMPERYSSCLFGEPAAPPSIDTPLHASCHIAMLTTCIRTGRSQSRRLRTDKRSFASSMHALAAGSYGCHGCARASS